jgi:electron transfer flavoprotein alpha/beta subunit
MSKPKSTALEMERHVESQIRELARTGKLPSLETVLTVVNEIREKYRPQILAARRKSED